MELGLLCLDITEGIFWSNITSKFLNFLGTGNGLKDGGALRQGLSLWKFQTDSPLLEHSLHLFWVMLQPLFEPDDL